MKNQLKKASILNLLLESDTQYAIGRVHSLSLDEEMSLIGFLPYTVTDKIYLYDSFYVNLNDDIIVTPHVVRCRHNRAIIPIFHTINKAFNNRYFIMNNLLLGTITSAVSPASFVLTFSSTESLNLDIFSCAALPNCNI